MPLQSTSGAATYDAFGVSAVSAVTQAEAIDFDGTNDYLSRSSDLVGNTDGRTFTFSAWVWNTNTTDAYIYANANNFYLGLNTFGRFVGSMTNTSGTVILDFVTPAFSVPINTWTNVLVSIDLTNSANRSVYINDIAQSVTWTTYSNQNIDFTKTTHYIDSNASGVLGKTRLSNVYLDKTYRDLSNVTNRRLFVTADLKPALGQAALNPIMYLPMSNPTAPGTNSGTGGDFALTGVVARSGRGPNQYNAPYSSFATNKYLTLSSTSSGFNNVVSFQCAFKLDTTGGSRTIFSTGSSARAIWVYLDTGKITIAFNNGGSVFASFVQTNTCVAGRNYILTFSVDFRSTSTRQVYLNGESLAGSWTAYANDSFDAGATPYRVGARSDGLVNYWDAGVIGQLWMRSSFNTGYINLSTPANLAKFVTGTGINAMPADLGANGELPTGTSPLVYLPLYANDPGKNYGTLSAFTPSTGFTGSRGPNEYWGNRAQFPGTSGSYLRRTSALTGISNTRQFSCSMFFLTNQRSGNPVLYSSSSESVSAYVDSSGILYLSARNAAGTVILDANSSSGNAISDGTLAFVQICFDLTDSAKRFVYINGTARAMTWNTYSNADIGYTSSTNWSLGANTAGSNNLLNGYLSEVYLANSYIDFSQEAERLKFRDAFGNPTDLPSAITAATVPTPVIYMRFPPTAFGTNSGTGGNFTVNGTITDGGQL